eukprot:10243130-Heterocapsa_arctica.AAC.1
MLPDVPAHSFTGGAGCPLYTRVCYVNAGRLTSVRPGGADRCKRDTDADTAGERTDAPYLSPPSTSGTRPVRGPRVATPGTLAGNSGDCRRLP